MVSNGLYLESQLSLVTVHLMFFPYPFWTTFSYIQVSQNEKRRRKEGKSISKGKLLYLTQFLISTNNCAR